MPPQLLRIPGRMGDEGAARKEAERLALALPDAAVFFAGLTILVALDDEWPPRALESADVRKVLPKLGAATWLDLGRPEAHRVPAVDADGALRGRGLLLVTSAPREGAQAVARTLRDLDDLGPDVDGWAVFARRGELAVVFRGGERLAESVARLVGRGAVDDYPLADPRQQRTMPHPVRREAGGALGRVLAGRTDAAVAMPQGNLFPDLLHLEDHAALGALGPMATAALWARP